MPVYVYRNLRTGETFEVEQRITESAWTEHPESGDPVKRLVQPVGIAFKGSGFYVTDSRGGSKAGGKEPAKDAPKAAEASKAAETKSSADAKPAAKSATPSSGSTSS